jgi:hypothetical protein
MKSLFLVHSPVTYLTSVLVINELKIRREDAIIIFFEFKKIEENSTYKSISINEYYGSNKALKKFQNYFHYFNVINRIDRIVNTTIGEEKFIAYVPVLIFAGKALITHTNCISFNFIEEGLGHYYREETLESLSAINSRDSWRSSISKSIKTVSKEMYQILRGYNFKLQSLPFSYSCYNSFKNVKFFGLSEESFPMADRQKKIIVPFEKKNFASIKEKFEISVDNRIIWIGDGGVVQYGFDQDIYMKGIKEGFIKFVKMRGEKNILLKFHRDEPEGLRKNIEKLFQDNKISFQVIPDSVIMELLLFDAKNVTLVGIYSSLLFYAAIMGHQSFSIYEFIKEEYSKALANRDFSFYWNIVRRLGNNDDKN